MNKSYKSVWNESTGSWVAVSELATGRSKSKRAKTAISKAILTQIAVGGMSLAGASAVMAATDSKLGAGAAVTVADGVAIGSDALAEADLDPKYKTETGAIAIGDSSYASGSSVAVGQAAQATGDSLAMGAGATAINGSTALGNNARAFNANTLAIGSDAAATAMNAVSIGANTTNEFANSVALGQGSVTDRENSVSVGSTSVKRQITNVADATQDSDAVTLNQLKSIGIKTDTNGAVTNSFVAYDANKAQALITLGGAGGTKITNVAAGNVAAGSTDAINGAQLLGVAQSAAAAIGGSSTVGADGKISKPSYTVGGVTYDNVGAAIDKAASMGGTGGTGGGTDDLAVHYDSAAQSSVKLGKDGSPVKMTNLATGTADTDAVNVAQMKTSVAAGLCFGNRRRFDDDRRWFHQLAFVQAGWWQDVGLQRR
jgi:trimeric autotransporter adhesin